MRRRPPRATRTDTLFPYTTLFRSHTAVLIFGGRESRSTYTFRSRPSYVPIRISAGRTASRGGAGRRVRSEEHTSELQSLMRISYAVFCLKKKKHNSHLHITKIIKYTHNYMTHIRKHTHYIYK